jgi:hypothetical protein
MRYVLGAMLTLALILAVIGSVRAGTGTPFAASDGRTVACSL